MSTQPSPILSSTTSPIDRVAATVASPESAATVVRSSSRAQLAYVSLCESVGVEPRL